MNWLSDKASRAVDRILGVLLVVALVELVVVYALLFWAIDQLLQESVR